MSSVYIFEKIDNSKGLQYNGRYTPNRFYFGEIPYFTIISTSYNGDSYNNAYSEQLGRYVTGLEIANMLGIGVKVDLVVEGDTDTLILPQVRLNADDTYFSDGELTLKVDANGAVTEGETNANK